MVSPNWHEAYHPGVSPLVHPWVEPERNALLVYRHLWPRGRVLLVFIMLLAALWDGTAEGYLWALGFGGLYLGWVLMCRTIEHDPRLDEPALHYKLSALSKWVVLGGLIVLTFLNPDKADRLWLLCFIPLLTLGVDLHRPMAQVLTGVAAGFAFLSAFPVEALELTWPEYFGTYGLAGLLRALIVGYVSAVSYLLARCLAYQHTTSRRAIERLLELVANGDWLSTTHETARIVAELFGDQDTSVTVNILSHDPETHSLRLIGSSSVQGQQLAKSGFTFPDTQGISGWAIRQAKPCFLNDARLDPEGRFLWHKAFPDTRSALAVPFETDRGQQAVLELESVRTAAFATEDLQLLHLITSHLVWARHRTHILELHRRLAELGQGLAHRVITIDEMHEILWGLIEAAHDLLEADLVGFHYRHPETNEIQEPLMVGALLCPAVRGSLPDDGDNIVSSLMQEQKIAIFSDAQNDPELTRMRVCHREQGVRPFVEREGVISCAAVPLVVGQTCIGLMWVNYRRREEFPPALQHTIQLLAPLMALAIHSSLQHILADSKRRAQIQRDFHDSLEKRLQYAAWAVEELYRTDGTDSQRKEAYRRAQCNLRRAQRVVTNLLGQRDGVTLQLIEEDIRMQAELIEQQIQGLSITIEGSLLPATDINPDAGNELLFACEEAMGNVIRHSHATHLRICLARTDDTLDIHFIDNGQGFDPNSVRRGIGLPSIFQRVEQTLGGKCTITSSPTTGTEVRLSIPLHISASPSI